MLFKLILRTALPAAAFLGGYGAVEDHFRAGKVPYPFEQYGLAVGLACFFFTLGTVVLAQTLLQKRRRT